MAFTYQYPKAPTALFSGVQAYIDTDAGSTCRDIVTGGTAIKLKMLWVDNSGNKGTASFVKMYAAASGSVTVGTTVPWLIWKIPWGYKGPLIVCPKGLDAGTDLSVAVVTTGGTGGTTSPTSDVTVIAYVND